MEESEKEKDLGVIVDNKLNFEEHITEKVNKETDWWDLLGEHLLVLMRKCLSIRSSTSTFYGKYIKVWQYNTIVYACLY